MTAPPVKIRLRDESRIQDRLISKLRSLEWFVKVLHGNAHQSGMPDLFACHKTFGQRFIEVKNPVAFSFTNAQLIDFPVMVANGGYIWILTDDSDEEYKKLFKPCNLLEYLVCYHDGVRNIDAWRAGRRK
jgi:hypothetical protein